MIGKSLHEQYQTSIFEFLLNESRTNRKMTRIVFVVRCSRRENGFDLRLRALRATYHHPFSQENGAQRLRLCEVARGYNMPQAYPRATWGSGGIESKSPKLGIFSYKHEFLIFLYRNDPYSRCCALFSP